MLALILTSTILVGAPSQYHCAVAGENPHNLIFTLEKTGEKPEAEKLEATISASIPDFPAQRVENVKIPVKIAADLLTGQNTQDVYGRTKVMNGPFLTESYVYLRTFKDVFMEAEQFQMSIAEFYAEAKNPTTGTLVGVTGVDLRDMTCTKIKW